MSEKPDWAGHSRGDFHRVHNGEGVTGFFVSPVPPLEFIGITMDEPDMTFRNPADAALFVAATDPETGYAAVLGVLAELLGPDDAEYDGVWQCRHCAAVMTQGGFCTDPNCSLFQARAIIEKTGGGSNE